MKKYKIIICIYACVVVDKYRKQVEKINETWGKFSDDNILILFF